MLSSRSDTVFGIQLFSDCVFPCSYTYAPLCESIWRKTTSQPSWVQGASSYCLGATGFQCCFPVVCTESWKDPEWIQLKKTTRERYWILTSVLDLLAKSRSFGASSSWEAADRNFGCLVKSGNRKRVKERFQKIQTKNSIKKLKRRCLVRSWQFNQLVDALGQVLHIVRKDEHQMTDLGCRSRCGGGSTSLQAALHPP